MLVMNHRVANLVPNLARDPQASESTSVAEESITGGEETTLRTKSVSGIPQTEPNADRIERRTFRSTDTTTSRADAGGTRNGSTATHASTLHKRVDAADIAESSPVFAQGFDAKALTALLGDHLIPPAFHRGSIEVQLPIEGRLELPVGLPQTLSLFFPRNTMIAIKAELHPSSEGLMIQSASMRFTNAESERPQNVRIHNPSALLKHAPAPLRALEKLAEMNLRGISIDSEGRIGLDGDIEPPSLPIPFLRPPKIPADTLAQIALPPMKLSVEDMIRGTAQQRLPGFMAEPGPLSLDALARALGRRTGAARISVALDGQTESVRLDQHGVSLRGAELALRLTSDGTFSFSRGGELQAELDSAGQFGPLQGRATINAKASAQEFLRANLAGSASVSSIDPIWVGASAALPEPQPGSMQLSVDPNAVDSAHLEGIRDILQRADSPWWFKALQPLVRYRSERLPELFGGEVRIDGKLDGEVDLSHSPAAGLQVSGSAHVEAQLRGEGSVGTGWSKAQLKDASARVSGPVSLADRGVSADNIEVDAQARMAVAGVEVDVQGRGVVDARHGKINVRDPAIRIRR
ncbi:MAG: polymer-forming cytoskeletal protein [Myxococcota bacterium]